MSKIKSSMTFNRCSERLGMKVVVVKVIERSEKRGDRKTKGSFDDEVVPVVELEVDEGPDNPLDDVDEDMDMDDVI